MMNESLIKQIIHAYYKVYNTLGFGFPEKIYENALAQELRSQSIEVEQQQPIQVFYEKELIGEFFADLLVGQGVLVIIKAEEKLRPDDDRQIMNYLKATTIEAGLLLNFGRRTEFKQKVFQNELKKRKRDAGKKSGE